MTAIANIPNGWAAVFWGVITFSLLIVLHEGGHFLAARAFGVKVHEFMLGLPAPGLKWRSRRSGIRYGVTVLPLGGYVRIAGMEPGREDELLGEALGHLASETRLDANGLAASLHVPLDRATALLTTLEDYGAADPVPDSQDWVALVSRGLHEDDAELLARVRSRVYRGQPVWKRVLILAMGVLVNIVSAIVILTAALALIGVPSPTTTVAAVAVSSPASRSGVQPGDRVLAFDGKPITDWSQLKSALAVAKPDVSVPVVVLRAGRSVTLTVKPSKLTGGGSYLGVTAGTRNAPMPIGTALRESFLMTGAVFVAVGRFLDPATFSASLQNARSVVGISYEVATAASEGPLAYAWMVALLSLSLGIMNMLPIPPLDGGKIAMEVVEYVSRRPVPRRASYAVSAVGTILLFSLVFYLMYADVVRYVIRG
jgi:regulator of sigma E protease